MAVTGWPPGLSRHLVPSGHQRLRLLTIMLLILQVSFYVNAALGIDSFRSAPKDKHVGESFYLCEAQLWEYNEKRRC